MRRSSNGLIVSRGERLVQREAVDGAESVRRISRTKDLLRVTSPFRVVDTVDPILDFHDETVVLADGAWATAVEETLGVLDGEGAWKCVSVEQLRRCSCDSPFMVLQVYSWKASWSL